MARFRAFFAQLLAPLLYSSQPLSCTQAQTTAFLPCAPPSELALATSSVAARKLGGRMRHSSFHRQSSDCALGLLPKQAQPFSSLPTQHPRGGARAHLGSRAASRLGPGSWRRGAGLFPLGSHPLWPGVPAAPARSRPVSILELGGRGRGRPGREQGCGAVGKLRRRGKGVRTQGRSAAPQLHSFSCSGERGREREEARAGLGAVTLGPQLERSRAAGRPRGGPRVGGRRPGAQAPGSQILGLGPSFLKYPGIKPSYIKYLGL